MGTLVERLAEALVPNQQMRVASVRWSHCAGAEHRRRAIGRNGSLSATIRWHLEKNATQMPAMLWQRTPPEPPRIIASPWRSQGPAHPGEE